MSVILLTGLSASGKTTIAEKVKYSMNLSYPDIKVFILDGDVIRNGLNKDLGFCDIDREENLRRIAEIARIILDNHEESLVLIAAIAPFKCIRECIKEIIRPHKFYEIFIKCPLEICEERDPKKLYKYARSRSTNVMTGLGSKYEEPIKPDLLVETNILSIEESVDKVINFIKERIK